MSKSRSRKGKHYIDGKKFTELANTARESGDFADELIAMFYLLAEKIFDTTRGVPRHSYVLIEEENAVQEAVVACFTGIHTFEAGKSAYTFFRAVIRNCFIKLYESAARDKRDPGSRVLNIESHKDIVTDNRMSYLLLKSERHYYKLCPSDAVEIRRRLANGEPGSRLARDYNVNTATISKIKHGKMWKDA